MAFSMNRAGAQAMRSGARLADWIWPSRSIISGQTGLGDGPVPPADWASLSFIDAPLCTRCGRPMEYDLGEAAPCGACAAKPPPWARGRAALVYDDTSRRPILELKRAGRREGLGAMAAWMARAGAPLLSEADLIVPVPLHYTRLVSRGHNQSGWLAAAVSRVSGVPACQDALRRRKRTPSQAGLNARARQRNVAGAFDVRPSRLARIKGRRIVLVDDVLTTGATLKACARALDKAGALDVDVLVLARVVRETDVTI